MNKLIFFSLFFGLPIVCGEWDGPFWIQAMAALTLLVVAGLCMWIQYRKETGTYHEE